jgi:hypothetical protein
MSFTSVASGNEMRHAPAAREWKNIAASDKPTSAGVDQRRVALSTDGTVSPGTVELKLEWNAFRDLPVSGVNLTTRYQWG